MILSSRINIDEYFERQSEVKTSDKSFLDSIIDMDILPLNDCSIRFSDDKWVFKVFTDEINYESVELDFSKVYYYYKDIAKGMIYEMKYLMGLADSTLKNKLYNIIKFLNFLESKYIVSYNLIDSFIITEYLDLRKDLSEHGKTSLKFSIDQFLSFIEENFNNTNFSNIRELLKKNDKVRRSEKAERENGKTSLIPEDIFNSLISCAIEEIESDTCSYLEKLQACLIIILSQTGIRIGEARKIKANMTEDVAIFDEEEIAYYLKYYSPKSKKEAKTFFTTIAKKAYDSLESETQPYREEFEVDYLFFNKETGKLYSVNDLRTFIFKFIVRNNLKTKCLDRSPQDVEGFHTLDLNGYSGSNNINGFYLNLEKKETIKGYKTMAIPTPHMFRVTVCTELVKQGVDIDWVREHMNHLYEEMTVHYVRNEKQSKIEKESAKALLKEVLMGEVRLIGKDSESMIVRIEEFISNNNFNVKDDLSIIIEELAGKIPIRKKENGYCIKSAFGRKCSIDSGMNDIYCAFGVCNNHFITYKSIDISYIQFVSLIKTIEYNVSAGFKAQASIELNKLHRLTEDILLPQLNEIEYEISRKVIGEFISDNPNIKDCIENRESIMNEVLKWKEMRIETMMKC